MARRGNTGAGTGTTSEGQQPAAQPAADQPEYVTQILQQLRDLTNKVSGLDDKINAEKAAQDAVKQQNDVKTYLEGRVAKTPKDKKDIYDNACAAAKLTGDIKYTTIDGLFKQDLNDEQKTAYDAIPETERRKWIDELYASAPAGKDTGKEKGKPKLITKKPEAKPAGLPDTVKKLIGEYRSKYHVPDVVVTEIAAIAKSYIDPKGPYSADPMSTKLARDIRTKIETIGWREIKRKDRKDAVYHTAHSVVPALEDALATKKVTDVEAKVTEAPNAPSTPGAVVDHLEWSPARRKIEESYKRRHPEAK